MILCQYSSPVKHVVKHDILSRHVSYTV